jgi:hypothetical protein
VGLITAAAIRPDEWNLPLFLHVLGALTLIGTLALTVTLLLAARRDPSAERLRLAVRSLTAGVIPAWFLLRVTAEWIADKEGYADLDDPPSWINVGYIATDAGLLLLLITAIMGWVALRRARATEARATTTVPRVAVALLTLLIVINVVALWAMTTKPA